MVLYRKREDDMEMEIFGGMYIPIVMAACLITGFILKKWIKDLDNKWIPTILVVFGAVLGCLANRGITLENVVAGAFSGLATTGMHQTFKQLISKEKKPE